MVLASGLSVFLLIHLCYASVFVVTGSIRWYLEPSQVVQVVSLLQLVISICAVAIRFAVYFSKLLSSSIPTPVLVHAPVFEEEQRKQCMRVQHYLMGPILSFPDLNPLIQLSTYQMHLRVDR